MATAKTAAKTAAPKKDDKATTSVAVRKPASGAVVSLKDALKAQADAMGDRVQPVSGTKIRCTKSGFSLPDGTEAQEIELVVVDFTSVNAFYDRPYNPKEISPPACFAINPIPKNLVPSGNSPDKQCDDCAGCPNNEFGSKGNGKACSNMRRLAVLPADDADAEMWTMDVSATAVKGFDKFVAGVKSAFGMPPISAVVKVTLDATVDYPKVVFSDIQPNENLEAHFARQAEATELLKIEFDVSGYQPLQRAPARKTAARR